MARIVQSILVGLIALGLGYFLGHRHPSRPHGGPPQPGASPVANTVEDPAWDLSFATTDQRKNKCLESLGGYSVPLLTAPELEESLARPLTTNFEGELYLKWKPVPKAKSYIISVEDKNGNVLKTYKASSTFTYLKSLPKIEKSDAHFYLRMATQNLNELIGPPGVKQELIVKKALDLTAPKIEEIKIED